VSRSFVTAAHERNMRVHVWTVNDHVNMQRLIDLKVDGIVTDHPEILLQLLQRQ
jgi:glycerophosphoryl diester phosphodiesterase